MTDNERREMEQMRRDAEQRVREMNARARAAVSGAGNRQQPRSAEQEKPPHSQQPANPPTKTPAAVTPAQNKGLGLLKMLNFQSLKLDNDIMVIAMMIMLLGSDDADELLLLALLYIMW